MTAALLAAGAALGAPPRDAALQLSDAQPIQLAARSTDFDLKNNLLVFHFVRIAQGGLAIEADDANATGLDFKESHWLFHGNVRITIPDGLLTSDEARIAFAANLISAAEITGAPARFSQKREKGMACGRARRIEYQPVTGTVRLTEDAWLSDSNHEINAQTLVYNMNDQRVLANPEEQGSQSVRITINPNKPDPKADVKPAVNPCAPPDGMPEAKPSP